MKSDKNRAGLLFFLAMCLWIITLLALFASWILFCLSLVMSIGMTLYALRTYGEAYQEDSPPEVQPEPDQEKK